MVLFYVFFTFITAGTIVLVILVPKHTIWHYLLYCLAAIFLTYFVYTMVLIYKANHYFEYAGLLIYAVAAFTFYKLTLAIYNIFKARKHNDLYIQNIRNINLASALISIIMLQVAMFQAFSPTSNMGIANALTGAGVSVIILVLGIFMIVKENKKLKAINKESK